MNRLLIFLAVLVFAIGCGNPSDGTHEQSQDHADHDHDSEHGSHNSTLSLNSGAKWQVNSEMMVFVAESEKLAFSFEPGSESDYASLAKSLDENKNQLIVNCTMKGASHDALHLWLEPYMDGLLLLANAQTESEKAAALDGVKKSFESFHLYFE